MMTFNKLIIQGAEENNLKKINVEIPLQKITTIIGVSGSGKSSLIYNVIAAESHRKEKIDSGLAECKDYAIRPKFTKIENLPYCVVVKQRGLQQSHSSTLATITGLHELLRDEFVKAGKIICQCGIEVFPPTLNDIANFLEKKHPREAIELFAIVAHEKYSDCAKEIELLKKHKIQDSTIISSYNEKEVVKNVKTLKLLNGNYLNTIKVNLGVYASSFNLKKALETYQAIALDSFQVIVNTQSYHFKYDYICSACQHLYHPISSSLLSFNTTVPKRTSGLCDVCHGHGEIRTLDYEQLIIPNKSLNEQFLNLEHTGSCYKYTSLCDDSFAKFCKENKVDNNKDFFSLAEKCQKKVMGYIEDKLLGKANIKISKFIKIRQCYACQGNRLNYKANAIKLFSHSISELLVKTVDELLDFFGDKEIHHHKILTILSSLTQASVGYLTLERPTTTFSGGELQRIKLAIQLNNNYKNLLYILDEPSIGLHAYDNLKFINLIKTLKDQGNTVIVSEHNTEYIKSSDYIIELGVGGGVNGGNVTSSRNINTYELPDLEVKRKIRPIDLTNAIFLDNVSCNNIKDQSFIIPLNALVAISGVSGSGKSSLIHRVLSPVIKQYLADGSLNTTYASNVRNLDKIKSLVELDQSQIGVNSRSIIATYIGCFDKIRDIFSSTQSATLLDLSSSAFSFNSDEGQCEYCAGLGEKESVLCPSCLGSRYIPQVLEVKYNDLSIADILNLTIDEALLIFKEVSNLFLDFTVLIELGLGHLTLGRSTPTLSGGEGQRLKLAKSLIESKSKMKNGNFMYILDEPTTGLSYKDINRLFSIFDEILQYNNTIIVIEHNLNIIKHSDYIIDMGLGAGQLGGNNVFSGQYSELFMHSSSITAKAFRDIVDYHAFSFSALPHTVQEKKYSSLKNSHKTDGCQQIYLSGQAFEIEKSILSNYSLHQDSNNFKFFDTKENVYLFANNLVNVDCYAFNPFVTDFFVYKKIGITAIKNKLLNLSSSGFDLIFISGNPFSIQKDLKRILLNDPWHFKIITDTMEQAYNYGNGWLSVITKNEILELSTRLVSLKHKVIGSPKITTATFNRYLNPCKECHGSGFLTFLDDNLIIKNIELSILDDGFFYESISSKLKSIMRMEIKPAIKKFKDEGLFDFSKPFNLLDTDEKDMFFHGFIHNKFLKPNGNKNTKGDYIVWKGLYFYVRDNVSRFEKSLANEISSSITKSNCPFCKGTGFNKELELFFVEDVNIMSLLNK